MYSTYNTQLNFQASFFSGRGESELFLDNHRERMRNFQPLLTAKHADGVVIFINNVPENFEDICKFFLFNVFVLLKENSNTLGCCR